MDKKPHIAIIPSPGFSHLFPIIEFSKQLVHLHPNFHITCIIPSLGSPPSTSQNYLQSLPPNISSIFLPPIPKQSLPQEAQEAQPGVQIQITVNLSLPHILKELKTLSSEHDLVALVADVFAHEALDFASELNLKSYVYVPLSAMFLSIKFYCTKLDEKVDSSLEFRDVPEPFNIPGCVVPLRGRDFPSSLQDRGNLPYKHFLERARRFHLFDGILVNSFQELESEAVRVLQEEKKTRIYMVGPIIQNGSGSDSGPGSDYCLKWLDNQPSKSVLYVSFGSGGTLTQEQLSELAFGLEHSGQRFLWVVRSPSETSSAAYLNSQNDNPLDFLPRGFLERTQGRGLVVPSWAPQIPILKHGSTGGFLSHCGWNSTLESVAHGVPLIAWPLFAEQRTNSVLLRDGLRVALWPDGKESGIVGREEVSEVVRRLMDGEEGKEMRKRMGELKVAAANALKEDGSSTKDLSLFAMDLRGIRGNFGISEEENIQG